jgi:hypothetical protein
MARLALLGIEREVVVVVLGVQIHGGVKGEGRRMTFGFVDRREKSMSSWRLR